MKSRLVLVLILAALIAAVAFFFARGPDEDARSEAEQSELAEKREDPKRDRRSLLPQKFPEQKSEEEETEAPKKSRFTMEIAEQPALSGIDLAPSTEEDRKRAGVTGQYGQGVTVTRIHPDSSAAEVAMEVGDVIVRAQKENVNSVEDLKRIVGDRDHTVVNFMRQGQLMSVVLQKPYQKPAN